MLPARTHVACMPCATAPLQVLARFPRGCLPRCTWRVRARPVPRRTHSQKNSASPFCFCSIFASCIWRLPILRSARPAGGIVAALSVTKFRSVTRQGEFLGERKNSNTFNFRAGRTRTGWSSSWFLVRIQGSQVINFSREQVVKKLNACFTTISFVNKTLSCELQELLAVTEVTPRMRG